MSYANRLIISESWNSAFLIVGICFSSSSMAGNRISLGFGLLVGKGMKFEDANFDLWELWKTGKGIFVCVCVFFLFLILYKSND